MDLRLLFDDYSELQKLQKGCVMIFKAPLVIKYDTTPPMIT